MVRSSTADWTPADGGPKLSTDESSGEDRAFPAAVARSASDAFGWAACGDATVSARSAGTPSMAVSSAAARTLSLPAASLAAEAGAPLAAAPLAGASCFPAAGVPFGETPAAAVPSDAASLVFGGGDLVVGG